MHRKDFITQLSILAAGTSISLNQLEFSSDHVSEFSKHLQPVGRALEMEGYFTWCNSPIQGEDGLTHVFFSRWDAKKGMGGWINGCEICHAVSESPEGPFKNIEVILAPRAGYFDATTCHNPSIKKVDGKYALFYMGNSNGKTNTKRIGLAVSESLNGPWMRSEKPLLDAGEEGSWDDHCTTNPSFIKHPNGQYWLYYKSWNTHDYETDKGPIKGNRKYGLAIADHLQGPYIKYAGNPIIDFSARGNNAQLEDAFIWRANRKFKMLCRDMGYYNHEDGIIMESKDGKDWGKPETAWYSAEHYGIKQPPPAASLKRYGRFERPQILFIDNQPAYLFTCSQGGKYMTASSYIFKIIGLSE
jgi:hypothetical protein